VSAKLPGP